MAVDGDFTVDFEEFARLSRYTAFLYFKTMSDALGKDTQRYQAEVIKLKAKQSDEKPLTPEEYAELGFWYRGYARALLIFVEGLLYVMRQLISHAEERGEIRLSLGESYLIRETDYLIQGDKIQERPRFSRLTDSFRLAFRLFPQVFGSAFAVDYVNDGWVKFRRLVALRNGLTHPKSVRDTLLSPELINVIRDAALWFFSCMKGITSSMDGPLMERSYRETVAMPEVKEFRDRLAQKE